MPDPMPTTRPPLPGGEPTHFRVPAPLLAALCDYCGRDTLGRLLIAQINAQITPEWVPVPEVASD